MTLTTSSYPIGRCSLDCGRNANIVLVIGGETTTITLSIRLCCHCIYLARNRIPPELLTDFDEIVSRNEDVFFAFRYLS